MAVFSPPLSPESCDASDDAVELAASVTGVPPLVSGGTVVVATVVVTVETVVVEGVVSVTVVTGGGAGGALVVGGGKVLLVDDASEVVLDELVELDDDVTLLDAGVIDVRPLVSAFPEPLAGSPGPSGGVDAMRRSGRVSSCIFLLWQY
jgi:hypothetical protein